MTNALNCTCIREHYAVKTRNKHSTDTSNTYTASTAGGRAERTGLHAALTALLGLAESQSGSIVPQMLSHITKNDPKLPRFLEWWRMWWVELPENGKMRYGTHGKSYPQWPSMVSPVRTNSHTAQRTRGHR